MSLGERGPPERGERQAPELLTRHHEDASRAVEHRPKRLDEALGEGRGRRRQLGIGNRSSWSRGESTERARGNRDVIVVTRRDTTLAAAYHVGTAERGERHNGVVTSDALL